MAGLRSLKWRVAVAVAALVLVCAAPTASANENSAKDAAGSKAEATRSSEQGSWYLHHREQAPAPHERQPQHHYGSSYHHRDDRRFEKFKETKSYQPAPPVISPACHPECRWQCDDPVCPAECHPLCNPSECEIECHEGPCAQCKVSCEEPECTVRCPKEACEKGDCPKCETVCAPPKCSTECQAPEPICAPVCAPTQCRLSCNKPHACPRPKCELVCEKGNCSVGQAVWDDFAETHCCPCTAFTLNIAMIAANEHRFKHNVPALVEGRSSVHGKNGKEYRKLNGPLVVAAVKKAKKASSASSSFLETQKSAHYKDGQHAAATNAHASVSSAAAASHDNSHHAVPKHANAHAASAPVDEDDDEGDDTARRSEIGDDFEDYMSLIEVMHTEHHARTQGTSEMCCPCNALNPVPINVPNPYKEEAKIKFK